MDIMSDTKGVDLGPYMRLVILEVKEHWPASAQKTGEQTALGKEQPLAANCGENGPVLPEYSCGPLLRFTVLPDGKVTMLRIEHTTKDVALDRAAWTAITATEFPPLPSGLHAPLELRASFSH
jgi:TonB family protein